MSSVSERTLDDTQGERTLQSARAERLVELRHPFYQSEQETEMRHLHWGERWHVNIQLCWLVKKPTKSHCIIALKCQNVAPAMIEPCQISFYMWVVKGRVKTACGRDRNIAKFFEIGWLVLFVKFYTEDKLPAQDFVLTVVYSKYFIR